MKKQQTPDEVCAEANGQKIRLDIRLLDKDMVVIQGNKRTLEFVGKLLLAQARSKGDCGFQLSPTGPGRKFFRRSSAYGLYIHLLPCQSSRV